MYLDIIKHSTVKPRLGTEEERKQILVRNTKTKMVFLTSEQMFEFNKVRNLLKWAIKTLTKEEYIPYRDQLVKWLEKINIVFASPEDFEREALASQRPDIDPTLTISDIALMVDNFDPRLSIIEMLSKYPVPNGWADFFRYAEAEIVTISKVIQEERLIHTVVPKNNDIFRSLHYTPLSAVRVVIVGQDPYPYVMKSGDPVAMGLCFGTKAGVGVQRSLTNIYTNIQRSYPWFKIPNHGDLTYWARQGVLLLNSSMTCIVNQPNSHRIKWNGFIRKLIETIANTHKHCIFVFWGDEAAKIRDDYLKTGIHILGPHPTPHNDKMTEEFLANPFFRKINRVLTMYNSTPIDWMIPLDHREGYTRPIHGMGVVNPDYPNIAESFAPISAPSMDVPSFL